jgi:hypothetical protein
MRSTSTFASGLPEALKKLNETSAIAVRDTTRIPAPTSHFVVDHCLATHIARSKDSFTFVPDLGSYHSYSIFRSANEAWKHDQLPVLAVCAFSKSPTPFRKETGIQAVMVDQFLSDLKFAHRSVSMPNASPAFIIRHYPSPNEKFDDVILPAHANLIVYEAHGLAPHQLATLFDHVASIRGKIILCGNRSELADYHPVLTKAVERSMSQAVPHELRKALELPDPAQETLPTNHQNPVAPGNSSQGVPDRGSTHLEQLSPGDPSSARSPYFVWHAKTTNPAGFSKDDYDLVAIVDTDSIHSALARTRHFGAPSTENSELLTFSENNREYRSTQPGDVIVHRGIAQLFDGNGFKFIEPEIDKQPLPSHDWAPSLEPARLETPAPEPPRPKIGF